MIIRDKQFDVKNYEVDFCGRPLKMQVGKMAELCNGAVLVSYGETVILVTCTASARPKDGIDYFPLSVDFNEKLYAVGRIPGSFMRREGKPSLPAVLASRLIDRPMRPLFPSDLRNDVIISCEVLSVDRDCSPEITAMIGASAAVSISDVPFNGPIAGIVLGWDGEKYLFNPTKAERETNRMITTIAATHKKIVMIESEAREVPEDVMYEGIVQAHAQLQGVLDLIDRMVAEVGKPKFDYVHASFDQELFDAICADFLDEAKSCMDTDDKNVREARWNVMVDHWHETYLETHPDMDQYLDEITYKLQKKIVKAWLLEGHRVDGRALNEIRPLAAEVALIPNVHGSALFTRGQTQVLSIATLNTLSMAQKLDTIWEEESKRFMHHYNMPPYSTGDARAARSTSRREQGHGALVEKALEAVIPAEEDFPYAIRVVSEVLSSNGSTSQGSVCAATMALMDAGVPIKTPVAGISCGLIQDGDDYTCFIDIQGVEDFHGEMDFKVAGTRAGITAIQMDLKNDGLKHEIVKTAFEMTREARFDILDRIMLPAIPAPRKELAKTAPKMIQMKINPDKIREVIGSGGKVIQKITADTGTKIDINDDGTIYIASEDIEACRAARTIIENIVFEPEVGKLYYGKVVRIIPIGAFVELAPGKDGMVHIKDLEYRRTEKVEDVLNIGDMTWVKVTEIDDRGRVNLSRKEAIRERERLGLRD
ncbi:MAG: polyribonucleotide nucleotidyltransferase [Deltaproteobacteria bacterium]|nr:polyribonucleotide nucleotidyltransferase [Oscillospiraceae bacterium]MBR5997779.1 polyribonucleotide nucleotidyltransferase [Deltaproteobacteria bacterium]